MAVGSLKKLEVGARRLFFRGLAPMVEAARVKPAIDPDAGVERILLMRQDRLGDMIVTLPLIRILREKYGRVGVVVSSGNGIVLKYEAGIDVLEYGKRPGDFLESLHRARDFAPDAVVDMHFHDSTTSFVFSVVSGAAWRVHAEGDRKLPFNVRVPVPMDGHVMEAFADLLSGLGKNIDLDRATLLRRPAVSPEEEGFARRFWKTSGLSPEECVAVNVSAGSSNRDWEADKYAAVCGEVIRRGSVPLVMSSVRDRAKAVAVTGKVRGAVPAPKTPTILHLATLLRNVKLVVSPDTSVVHLAASMEVPVVGMYLPVGKPLPKWYPWRVASRVVVSPDSESLNALDAREVVPAVAEMLEDADHG